MRAVVEILAGVAILANGVIYGTDRRPTIELADPGAPAQSERRRRPR